MDHFLEGLLKYYASILKKKKNQKYYNTFLHFSQEYFLFKKSHTNTHTIFYIHTRAPLLPSGWSYLKIYKEGLKVI